jgi:hypothetical protein
MHTRFAMCAAGAVAMIAGSAVAAPLPDKQPGTTQVEAGKAEPHRLKAEWRHPIEIRDESAARGQTHSIARTWNEMLLFSIRRDLGRPTIHARNLYHTSAAMYDAWAVYDATADQVIHQEKLTAADPAEARRIAISYTMYRLLQHRFQFSPGVFTIFPALDQLMADQGLDPWYFGTVGNDPASLGNRIAQSYIDYGIADGANEANGYTNQVYQPINPSMLMDDPGNPNIVDPNRWQPLGLLSFVDQNGNPIPGGYPPFLSAEWGNVTPFSLRPSDMSVLERDAIQWNVYHDPGPPPFIDNAEDLYRWGFEMVSTWSAHLDPSDGVMWDISPNSLGNSPLPPLGGERDFYDRVTGAHGSAGYTVNPVTGAPYAEQWVPRGDYTRILAEFWADGPSSETPPGHWFSIFNYTMDHPLFERRFMGQGPELDPLEYDVKAYLALGGAMHDAAVSCWSIKGYYDYVRPVSAIRYLADQGQCTDMTAANFNPEGINLIPNLIENVTAETTAPGQRHEHLAGSEGKVAIKAWRGPTYITTPATDVAGVGWILAERWWPYQRPTFVSPPFAGYMSGHSTYSRTASELLTLLTGSEYFPGGLGEFLAAQNQYLVFEDGPSVDVVLQWARFQDASDQCSLSRIWGGIHPPCDDLPGRHIGRIIGPDSFHEARRYFGGLKSCLADFNGDNQINFFDIAAYINAFQAGDMLADTAAPYRQLNFFDLASYINSFVAGCP